MTIDLYPDIIKTNALGRSSVGFGESIDNDCKTIHDATKGWGANKQKVIDTLASKDAEERWKLAKRYPELYDKPLAELMKSEFSGDFGRAMTILAMPLDEAECYMLKKAMDGVGCNVHVVYSILCGRTNEELNMIKTNYFKLYTKDLGKRLAGELGGDMERYVLLSAEYNGHKGMGNKSFVGHASQSHTDLISSSFVVGVLSLDWFSIPCSVEKNRTIRRTIRTTRPRKMLKQFTRRVRENGLARMKNQFSKFCVLHHQNTLRRSMLPMPKSMGTRC